MLVDDTSLGAWADTLVIVGGMVFSGVLPFTVLSLFFGVFIEGLPLFAVAAVLLFVLLLNALLLLVAGAVRRITDTSTTTTNELQSFEALPAATQERFYRASGDHRPPTLIYGAALAGDAAKVGAVAYGVALAYVAFGILGVGLAAVMSGFAAARDHAQLETVAESYRPVTDNEIAVTVREYSDRMGIETPPVYDARLGSGPAAAVRTGEDKASILIDTDALAEYSEEERDAVIVHELTHIEQNISSRHPISLRPLPVLVALSTALLFTPPASIVGAVTFIGYAVIKLHLMRRHRSLERQADAKAAELVGPIPTAVALVRASDVAPLSIAQNPVVRLAEQFSSHPQTATRIDTLLADAPTTQDNAPLPQPIPDWDWRTEETEP